MKNAGRFSGTVATSAATSHDQDLVPRFAGKMGRAQWKKIPKKAPWIPKKAPWIPKKAPQIPKKAP